MNARDASAGGPPRPPAAQVDDAVRALRAGGIVCLPTETMYGLAVDIRDRAALARLSDLKGRAPDSPFGLIAADADMARGLCGVWPEAADELARAHWPGPLTLVVPARGDLPAELVGPGGGVGVRVPSHPLALAVAAGLGAPITATSANPSGQSAALSVSQARAYFGDRVDLYVDGGPAASETPSTVVSVAADGTVTVLRRGALAAVEPG